MKVAAAAVVACLTASAIMAAATPAQATTRSCRDTAPVVLKSRHVAYAERVRATRITCRRAREVARACVADNLHGWTISYEPLNADEGTGVGRIGLDRGQAHVSFLITGPTFGCVNP